MDREKRIVEIVDEIDFEVVREMFETIAKVCASHEEDEDMKPYMKALEQFQELASVKEGKEIGCGNSGRSYRFIQSPLCAGTAG